MRVCMCVCVCVRGVARRRPKDCALALSTNAAAEGVIKIAEGSGGMNASLGPGERGVPRISLVRLP